MDAQTRTTPAGGRSERRKPKSGMRSAGTQFGQLGLRSGLPHAPASFSSVSGSNTSTHFMSARCTAGAWMRPPAGGSVRAFHTNRRTNWHRTAPQQDLFNSPAGRKL
uniref:Uncharacterized protein n=1 Tax=Anopheles coluzzii TaxID=1518534 RepID=A0A8W7P558_ANOCL